MNPSGASNRIFDGHIEPMRQPHMNLIDATQALHLGGPRLSADAHEFVPFTGNPAPYYLPQQQQQEQVYTNFQGNRFVGQQQPYSQRQNVQQQQQFSGQYQHHQQQQRLPSSVQSRIQLTNNSNLDGGGGGVNSMYQGQPQQQQQHNPYHSHHQQQQQLMHGGGGGGRFNNNHHHHSHQQQQQHHHQEGQSHGGRRNGGMRPTTRGGGGNQEASADAGQSQEEVQALEMLRETMQQLADKPGMFEEYAMDLKEAFGDVIESRLVMSCAIEMLFEQSIAEPQCRYMGARLCLLLDTLATTSVSVNLFRELMILKLAHDETELPLCMQQEQLKVRGTALFLADLYVQLNSDGEQRIVELARSILATMELLLSKPGPENAKCVCQAMKLCGYQLEQDVGPDIEPVMAMLAKLEHELDTSSSRLIESVLKLRGSRWGRNTMGAQKSSSSSSANNHYKTDGPVYYGPDGQVLTDDEASFLNAHSISSAFMNGGSGGMGGMTLGNLGGGDPDDFNADMDPMVQEAYRQFLRSSNH